MLLRTITAVLLVIFMIPILILSDTYIFVAAVVFFSFAAAFELIRCLGFSRKFAIAIPSYLVAIVMPLGVRFVGDHLLYVMCMMAILFLYLFYLFALAVFSRGGLIMRDLSEVFMIDLYISCAFTSIILIRDLPYGQYLYLLIFIGAWVTDIFAYFTGVLLGRHKLIPEISPKKTVEGMIGGVVFCSAAYVLFGYIVGSMTKATPDYLYLALAGLVVSFVSQLGDLVASLIKRQHDIKDFGRIFPGHGGVLDRFDSVMAVAPFLLIWCSFPDVLSLLF
ncbi:MAG: phosphatidate cytidylyltransferase [Clostridiales bacterium]|nr:phosphatidate cytidylyltransferase [Clostridiales bacterium]